MGLFGRADIVVDLSVADVMSMRLCTFMPSGVSIDAVVAVRIIVSCSGSGRK